MMASDPTGQQFGDYRLVRALRQGGQASVYLGQHVRLQQKFAAIKLLQAQLSQEDIAGFQREADTIAELQHPQIVNILDFNVRDGIPYIIMDYYPAGTLRERHPRGERVALARVVEYVRQVGEALQYAHDHRVIHRDVKAANMLIGSRGDIVLSDFGIAAAAHSTTSMRAQSFAGTAPYMAPEQIKQFPRRESDQYALGIVAYEWLCGELPFSGTPEEIAVKHLAVEPPSLLERVPDLPPDAERAIFRALAKIPKERFASVNEFALTLEDVLQAGLHTSPLWAPLPVVEIAHDATEKLGRKPAPQAEALESGQEQGMPMADAEESEEGEANEQVQPMEAAPVVPETPEQDEQAYEEHTPHYVSDLARFYDNTARDDEARSPYHHADNTEPISSAIRFRLAEGRPLPLNGREVMRRVGRENTPLAWRVMLPSHGKLALKSLWKGLELALLGTIMVYALLWALVAFPPTDYPIPVPAYSIEQIWVTLQQWGQDGTMAFWSIFLIGPVLAGLLLGCVAALSHQIAQGRQLLVLLPEGLVHGKRGQQKGLQIINYWEVAELRPGRRQVFLRLFKKNGGLKRQKVDLALFPAPRMLARTIKTEHDHYKAEHGM